MIRPRPQRSAVVLFLVVVVLYTVMVVYRPGYVLWGLLSALLVAVITWARWRATRLELTEGMVVVRQGWYLPSREAAREDITAIHYFPGVISFRGPDGKKPIMKIAPNWTLRQMLGIAVELGVPLYDHRRWLGLRKVSTGRLVNDPASRKPVA